MRNRILALPAVLIGLSWFGAGLLRAQEEGIHWLDSYKEALKEAKRTQKPIFLEFRCEA